VSNVIHLGIVFISELALATILEVIVMLNLLIATKE
jgi:hypothetical protein